MLVASYDEDAIPAAALSPQNILPNGIRRLNICCIGAGYVGGPSSAIIAKQCPHIKVTIVDVNKDRIAAWNSPNLPIFEDGLDEIVKETRGRNLFFSTDVDQAIIDSDIIFVSVNTPTKKCGMGAGYASDLNYVESATRRIAEIAQHSKIVIEKSTVPCRTAESMRSILEENGRPGVKFNILSNPEFLSEGRAITDLMNPDRVLIGSLQTPEGRMAADILTSIYMNWIPREKIITMGLWSSELSKLAANALLAQRISSVNALSAICESTGADIDEVAHACGLDTRIGDKFLKAGLGFGGSCFQKDILNLVYLAESLHLPEVAAYWNQVIVMNEFQKSRFSMRVIRDMFNSISGKTIAIYGFAFKSGTGDTRESPAITIAQNFLRDNSKLRIYDPKVEAKQIQSDLSDGRSFEKVNVSICQSAYDAAENADAIVICTEWPEFKELDYRKIYRSMRKPAHIFDGRLVVDRQSLREIGFRVQTIGKTDYIKA